MIKKLQILLVTLFVFTLSCATEEQDENVENNNINIANSGLNNDSNGTNSDGNGTNINAAVNNNDNSIYQTSEDYTDIAGNFLFIQYVFMEAILPGGSIDEKILIDFYFAKLDKKSETEYEVTLKLCDINQPPGQYTTSTLTRKYIDTYEEESFTITTNESKFESETRVIVVGAKLDDPINDALPTEKDDPKVFDQEGDGKPGYTVKISGLFNAEVYMAGRTSYEMGGDIVNNNFLKGSIDWEKEEIILDATSQIIMNAEAETRENLEKSWIQFRRIKEEIDCSDIITYFSNSEYNLDDYPEEIY